MENLGNTQVSWKPEKLIEKGHLAQKLMEKPLIEKFFIIFV